MRSLCVYTTSYALVSYVGLRWVPGTVAGSILVVYTHVHFGTLVSRRDVPHQYYAWCPVSMFIESYWYYLVPVLEYLVTKLEPTDHTYRHVSRPREIPLNNRMSPWQYWYLYRKGNARGDWWGRPTRFDLYDFVHPTGALHGSIVLQYFWIPHAYTVHVLVVESYPRALRV